MEKVRNNSAHITNSGDEIDLSLLGLHIINALQRSSKLFVIMVVLGCVLGLFHHFKSVPVYETSMMGSSKVLTNVRLQNLIEVLNKLAKEGNALQLSKKLRVSHQLASTIQSIEAKSIGDLTEKKATYQTSKVDTNLFEITLSISDNLQVDSLQTGLLYYLQHNDFVERRIAIRKQNLKVMLEKVQEEQKKLDTLRLSVNNVLSKGVAGNSTMLILDAGSFNKDIMSLYEKELQIKDDLVFSEDIQVIQGFTPFSADYRPSLKKTLLINIGICIMLALVLIGVLEAWRGVKKFKEKTAMEQVVEGSAS